MVVVTLMWSVAGVVTRQLESAHSFEVTFWRSAFTVPALALLLTWRSGARPLAAGLRSASPLLWASGVCWAVMFTAFMVALTLTTVANVLVTMALAPVFTAMLSRVLLGHRLPRRTWAAVVVAGAGIGWMYGTQFSAGRTADALGVAVALAVPVAAAVNWNLLHHARGGSDADMLPAVLVGAVLSSVITLPLAWPFAATAHDLRWLAFLGVFQLAVPCLLAVSAARSLSAPEAALLALLEVIFGVAWAWVAGGERPAPAVLTGGATVLLALAGNELMALRGR